MNPPQCTLQKDQRIFHLIGLTGGHDDHQRIQKAIETFQPDHVCVALCQTRLHTLLERDQWLNRDVVQAIRDGHALQLLAGLAMTAYLHRLDHRHTPGAEFARAVQQARAAGLPTTLIDRDIKVTLKRAWRTLALPAKLSLLAKLLRLLWRRQPLSPDHHDRLLGGDSLSVMTDALTQSVPAFSQTLIQERDRLLMHAVESSPGQRVLAVVGAGPLNAMADHLGTPADPQLNQPPKPNRLKTLTAGLAAPLILLGLFLWAKQSGDHVPIDKGLGAWMAANLVLVGVFTLMAGARGRTILIAMLLSPISIFLPLIKAGPVAGVVEGRLRKPTVADCERLPVDMLTLKGAYHNPITRVLWVFLMASAGSAMGTWVGFFLVFKAWFS